MESLRASKDTVMVLAELRHSKEMPMPLLWAIERLDSKYFKFPLESHEKEKADAGIEGTRLPKRDSTFTSS